jgi:hypothetical protein
MDMRIIGTVVSMAPEAGEGRSGWLVEADGQTTS